MKLGDFIFNYLFASCRKVEEVVIKRLESEEYEVDYRTVDDLSCKSDRRLPQDTKETYP